jgi:hypothetical protein
LRSPYRVVPSVPDTRPRESILSVNLTHATACALERQASHYKSDDLLHDHRIVLETLACEPVSVACKPSLRPRLPRASGNGFLMPETVGPILALSGPASLQRLEASLCARAKSRVFDEPREISFCAGPGGLEPEARPLWMAAVFGARAQIGRGSSRLAGYGGRVNAVRFTRDVP